MRARVVFVAVAVLLVVGQEAAAQAVAPGALPASVNGVYASTNGRVIVLQVAGSQMYLPVWVAEREADVAQMYIQGRRAPRPLTHDLLQAVVVTLGGRVTAGYVSDLQGTTFIGRIDVVQGGTVRPIDARSSDAICTALGAGAPIYVMSHVLARAGMTRAQLAQQGIFIR